MSEVVQLAAVRNKKPVCSWLHCGRLAKVSIDLWNVDENCEAGKKYFCDEHAPKSGLEFTQYS